jgi:acetyl esterase/lipase
MPLIYFTHGGGDVSGHANQSGTELQRMADIHHVTVVTVEYRLAYTAPFPAAINDIYNGFEYCLEHAEEMGINTHRVVIMGESFGGGATASLALYNRDHKNYPISGEILIYPMLDYRTGTPDAIYHNIYSGEIGWTRKMNVPCWKAYCGGNKIADKDMPYFSAAMAEDLEDMPDTFIFVGSMDLFLDEDMTFASRLMQSGVSTELHVVPGIFHCFDMMSPDAPQTKEYKEMRFKTIERMLNK